jgi:hypothetical protein
MYIQPADTAVLMYDDAAGSNGNTAKTTGANGQVVVYVEAGTYRLSVNGVDSYVAIGKKDITTQDLIDDNNSYQVGDTVTTTGFTTAGDGGGAQWKLTAATGTASQSPAQLGDALLNDAAGKQWELVHNGIITPETLGAIGDGATDDLLPIRAAIAGLSGGGTLKTVSMYFHSDTILINHDDFKIEGGGSGTGFTRSNGTFGNSIEVEAPDVLTTTIFRVSISDIEIKATVEVTSGALLRVTEAAYCFFNNISIQNGFIGMHLRGLRACFIDGLHIRSGQLWAGVKANSRYMLIEDSPSPLSYSENVELFISNFDFASNSTNSYVEYALEVKEADGIWFSNGHLFSSSIANLFLNAASSPQLLGLKFSNVWMDGLTTRNLLIANTPAGYAGFYQFDGCSFTGATSVAIDMDSVDYASFDNPVIWECDSATAVNIGALCSNITFSNINIKRFNSSNAASAAVFRVAAGAENISINGGTIFDSPNADFGILDNGSTQLTVNGIAFNDFDDASKTIRVIDPATTAFNSSGCTTSQTSSYVPGNAHRGEFLSIADDTAVSVPIGSVTGGLLAVSVKLNSTYTGLIALENTGTATTALVSSGTGVEVTTGVLTGTTGTDTKLTVSVVDSGGALYIENRTGVTRSVVWNFISRDFNY